MVFRLVVDFGKPYEEEFSSESALRKELLRLKDLSNDDTGDVYIYDSKDKDITDKMFKKLKIMEN